MGRFRRSLTGLAAALLIACAAPGAAQAHAEVIAIDPADGSQLAQAPTVISITFSESIGVDADAIRIIDATGRQVDVAPESLAGFTLTQPLPALSDGWYLVSYRIVSADGHILHQASTFGVGAADAAARTAVLAWQSANDPLVWGARAAADLSLLIAAGVARGPGRCGRGDHGSRRPSRRDAARGAPAPVASRGRRALVGGRPRDASPTQRPGRLR
jgi:methionine-rich copper-binding protein CopC